MCVCVSVCVCVRVCVCLCVCVRVSVRAACSTYFQASCTSCFISVCTLGRPSVTPCGSSQVSCRSATRQKITLMYLSCRSAERQTSYTDVHVCLQLGMCVYVCMQEVRSTKRTSSLLCACTHALHCDTVP